MAKGGGGIVGIPPPPGVGSKDPPPLLDFGLASRLIKNHAKLQANGGKLVNFVIFHQK